MLKPLGSADLSYAVAKVPNRLPADIPAGYRRADPEKNRADYEIQTEDLEMCSKRRLWLDTVESDRADASDLAVDRDPEFFVDMRAPGSVCSKRLVARAWPSPRLSAERLWWRLLAR
eukprot:202527-Pyramimonas_sp.AAC.1